MRLRPHRGYVATGLLLAAALGGCSSSPADPAPSSSGAPIATAVASPTTNTPTTNTGASSTPNPSPTVTEPTTTNTLPAPPAPSEAAASTAGSLTAAVLPVPPGWHTVVKQGDQEEGYRGNGTWVHARDPRYAATDAISIGCAEVTRDDFTDPTSALEGSYENGSGEPGVGLALQFGSSSAATRFDRLYRRQVAACTDPGGPMTATVLGSSLGLIDHRTYADESRWTEVVKLDGSRLTLILLTDPDHRIGLSRAEAILRSIPG